MENHSEITVEERRRRLRKGVWLSLVLALVSFVVALFSTAAAGIRISRCTEETMGEVISFGHGRYSADKVYAAFTVDGERYMTMGRYVPGDFTDEERSSEKAPVKVWYEKGNPENAYANRSPVTYLSAIIPPSVFIVVAVMMFVWSGNPKPVSVSIDKQEDRECP